MNFGPQYRHIRQDISLHVMSAWNIAMWSIINLGIDLYDNQIEIVEAVVDLNVKELAILQARGAGKTFSVGVGLVKLCLEIPGIKIGIFGPKAEQANRIIECIKEEIVKRSSPIYARIDWDDTTNSRLTFANGSRMVAISASETAMQEGHHFNIVVLDECHRISDLSVNQRILPMLGSLPIGKVIKLGISLGRNNFYFSCNDPTGRCKLLSCDWTECKILLNTGSVWYKDREYPQMVVNLMPLPLKKVMFPDRPDLHFPSTMNETDFQTQYGMQWASGVFLVLNEEDQKRLVSGTHEVLTQARPGVQESYFFGLDTAGGSPQTGRTGLDYTVLAIWRLLPNGHKEKVASYSWQGNVLAQKEEIRNVIDPKKGLFPCEFGLVDYANIGIDLVESWKQEGIAVEGVTFGQREETSGKNFKNAAYDRFIFELQAGRIRYPALAQVENDPAMKTALEEWCMIERHKTTGINDKIEAPSDCHDDHPSSDVLAVWAIDKGAELGAIPRPLPDMRQMQKMPSVLSRFFPTTNNQPFGNRYLKSGYNPPPKQDNPFDKPFH